MRALVTGAAGFVGRQLVRRLLADAHEIRAIVRQAPTIESPRVQQVFVAGIEQVSDMRPLVEGCDLVFHLAAHVHVSSRSAEHTRSLFEAVNVGATERLVRAAADSGVARFVFVSTAGVHGDSSNHTLRESDPTMPASLYAASKVKAEEIVRAQSTIETVVLRPPSVYGPEVRAKFLALMNAIDRGLPLPFGSVANRRSMVFVENLVDAMSIVATHPKAGDKLFFVADDEALSTPELVRRLAQRLERRARLVPVPQQLLRLACRVVPDALRGAIESLHLDTSAIRQMTGWVPRFSNDQGLDATVAWYRSAIRRR